MKKVVKGIKKMDHILEADIKFSNNHMQTILDTDCLISTNQDDLINLVGGLNDQNILRNSSSNIVNEIANNDAPKTVEYESLSQFLPTWKQFFPWLAWSHENNILFCSHCHQILDKFFPDQIEKGHICSKEIFSVSSSLRKHNDSIAHLSCVYIRLYNNFKSYIIMTKNQYREMKQESEVMETLKSIFNCSNLEKGSFQKTVKGLGLVIENMLLKSIQKSKYFSVVADQCRGIIIVRWLSSLTGKWEEHVLWSYVSVWDMSPITYLKSLDLDYENKCTLYVANSLCQQCDRCEDSNIDQGALPPRPPCSDAFVALMWDLDFLKPLASLVNTIFKIFKCYPYKFSTIKSKKILDLDKFHSSPTTIIPILENIEAIKKIGQEIYESRSHVEALGLAVINIEKDEKFFKVLTLLEEIIKSCKDINCSTKITSDQIVKLSHIFNQLKLWSNGVSFIKVSDSSELSNDKVREFLQFIDKFIEENQKSVYYNGRDKIAAFTGLCSTERIVDSSLGIVNDQKLRHYFVLVYSLAYRVLAMKPNLHGEELTFQSVKNYHNEIVLRRDNVKDCVDVIKSFRENPNFCTQYPEAYELFQFCASMPFLLSELNASLFLSSVMEQRMESSIWTTIDKDMKSAMLYLQNELHIISHDTLLKWWIELQY